jgi:hypothetical protein
MNDWVLFCAEAGDTATEDNPVLFVSGDLLAAETIDTLGRVYPDLTFTRLDSGKFTPSHRNALREIMNQALRGELSDLYRRVALSAFECQENTLLALERAEEKGNLPKEITSEELHGMLGLLRKAAGSKDDERETEQSDAPPENKYELLAKIPDYRRNAYMIFLHAEAESNKKGNWQRLTDREAYEWLKENRLEDVGTLADYKLPSYDTWSRNLRGARKALREQQYVPRKDRQN